jgi:hypothetical protein
MSGILMSIRMQEAGIHYPTESLASVR